MFSQEVGAFDDDTITAWGMCYEEVDPLKAVGGTNVSRLNVAKNFGE